MISAKKLATIGAAAALFVVSASPASAWFFSSDDLNVTQSNGAFVVNDVDQNANTGNKAGGGHNFALGTGNAGNISEVANIVNSNKVVVKSCGCFDDVTVSQSNHAFVKNEVDQNANTGNVAFGFFSGGNKAMFTGDAGNSSAVANVVNSNVALSF